MQATEPPTTRVKIAATSRRLRRRDELASPGLDRRSARLFGLFRRYALRYVARSFHAVRVSTGGLPPELPAGPAVVVLNHPSWWDPLVGLVLAGSWPGRCHHAPIESAALAKYRFFERLGFFGVEPGTARGAREFLRVATAVAARPGAMLWITAQGRFADPRERPVRLRGGIGHLARRLSAGCILPLALEYPFWDERGPEALARFGRPIPIGGAPGRSAAEWTAVVASGLEATQDALAVEATARDPAAFVTVLEGSVGVGGVYDAWGRLRAAMRGERFHPGHGR